MEPRFIFSAVKSINDIEELQQLMERKQRQAMNDFFDSLLNDIIDVNRLEHMITFNNAEDCLKLGTEIIYGATFDLYTVDDNTIVLWSKYNGSRQLAKRDNETWSTELDYAEFTKLVSIVQEYYNK